MFISVACDLSSDDHREEIYNLLLQYGFKRVQKDVFECPSLNETGLARLKKDVDRATDFYDSVRIYQYPVEGTLVISALKENRWRKIITRPKK
jgi:CRISPR-associated protein Cas2